VTSNSTILKHNLDEFTIVHTCSSHLNHMQNYIGYDY